MDPISITGLVITIADVVSNLYDYSSAVKDSKDDIRKLTQEVFALKGALEHISTTTREYLSDKDHGDSDRDQQNDGMLKLARETLTNIQKRLVQPKSKIEKAKQALRWPFTKIEVENYIAAVERCKTWFIMVSMNETAERTSEIYNGVQQLAALIHEDIIARKTNVMKEETYEVIKWLAPVRSDEAHAEILQHRVPGTGRWFFDETFGEWFIEPTAEKPILWVTGKSGSGKTTLFSSIVQEFQVQCDEFEDDHCAFHYCSMDNAASQKPVNIFGSILAQAAEAKPELVDIIKPFQKPGASLIAQNMMTIQELTGLLEKALGLFKRFSVLIDALNETPHQRVILTTLLKLCTAYPGLKVIVTCTSDPVADKESRSRISLRQMRMADVNADIQAYVRYRLDTETNYQALSDTIRHEVENIMSLGANGMFRWAQLCMDHLAILRTGRDIRKALREMPTTLNETYVRLLQGIPLSDRAFAREALMWLCFSLRPLNLLELGEAVVLQEDDQDLDADCRLGNDEAILQICQGLVDYKRERKEVTLAHDSIRSFLTSGWIKTSEAAYFALNPIESHRTILRKCITYLSFKPFAAGRAPNLKSVWIFAYPLLPYVTQLWPIHSENFTLNTQDEDLILSFFDTKRHRNGGCFDSWVQFLLGQPESGKVEQTEPLYYAASYDMVPIVKLLLKRDPNIKIDAPGGRYGSTPLFIACYRGNIDSAKLLVEAGANCDAGDESGWSCREMAMEQGLHELVELMPKVNHKRQDGL
ncbi:ankyrin repeat protein [Rhizodiscina lignyota]|uniref:Ankyrin repeat protein n=1 Tax=Rhizodiscina lignyota TaxID=1504668 RepID=A0A9P4I569_9PEZI|nr:ankyrin repeat protein [Rhizodiscina lignyota]